MAGGRRRWGRYVSWISQACSNRPVLALSTPSLKDSADVRRHRAHAEKCGLQLVAIAAHEVLKTGNVGVSGNTSAVLQRSLTATRALIARSLAEVRLTQSLQNREQFPIAAFIEEVAAAASLETSVCGATLIVVPAEDDAVILADRQVLAAVLGNLLQNAFKFTRSGSTVTLRVSDSVDRVLIEIEDECGGLLSGNLTELFRPFEQQSANRTGLGLGLAFSRWGTEANDGRIYACNLPGRGCVFTVDLPRIQVPVSVVG
jgi:signal transduction histidine kinase